MRRLLWALGSVMGVLFVIETPIQACGDKLVSLARGIRLQRAYQAARSASILIYTGRSSGANTLKEREIQSSLKQAGHKIQTVENIGQFDQALTSGRFDLVLADLSEAPALAQRVASLPSRPLVLPVLYKPSRAELTAAEKQFSFAIKAPANSTQHLEAIDGAMKSKGRGVSSS